MYEMEQIDERVILVGIDTGNEDAANRSLDELSEDSLEISDELSEELSISEDDGISEDSLKLPEDEISPHATSGSKHIPNRTTSIFGFIMMFPLRFMSL